MLPVVLAIYIVFKSVDLDTDILNSSVDLVIELKILVILFPGLASAGCLVCLYFYPFTKEYIEEIKNGLNKYHINKNIKKN